MSLRFKFSARPLTSAILMSAVAAMGAGASMSASQNALNDVQVGEKGRLMRIALLCSDQCNVTSIAGDAFSIAGVDSDLKIPLAGRSKLANSLRIQPGDNGSILSIDTPNIIARATISECAIRKENAACIDLTFFEGEKPEKQASAAATVNAAALPTPPGPPSLKVLQEAPSKPSSMATRPSSSSSASAAMDASSSPRPALREAPNRDVLTFDRFSAPERLAPPKLAVLTPVAVKPDAALEVPVPGSAASTSRAVKIPTQPQPRIIERAFSLREQANIILGKRLDVGLCEGAQARLNNDAWALDAMIDVGFCRAANGDLDEADRLFGRLLAYTPDNYEALVGRALIAVDEGENGVARKYFQDALNALPPIKESNLIVQAMNRL